MLINPFKPDYDQKTVFEGSATKLAREVDVAFKRVAKKYNWPEYGFRAQMTAECRGARARKIKSKEAKELDFAAKVDEDFPIEFN